MPLQSLILQAAAIPMRDGRVCLVNSSSGRGWVIPKGHIEVGQTARETALQEAWEEAGLDGILEDRRVGSYRYEKNGNLYHVTAFLMHVTTAANVWPEVHRRQRRWINLGSAQRFVQVPGLRRVLRLLTSHEAVAVS
jgi:8-oxo-dGTP pyrophosphatase MutT (NUDIX family)